MKLEERKTRGGKNSRRENLEKDLKSGKNRDLKKEKKLDATRRRKNSENNLKEGKNRKGKKKKTR